MSTGKKMTREEIERGLEEYQRRQRENSGGWDKIFVNSDALLPILDPWAVIFEREKSGQTLQ